MKYLCYLWGLHFDLYTMEAFGGFWAGEWHDLFFKRITLAAMLNIKCLGCWVKKQGYHLGCYCFLVQYFWLECALPLISNNSNNNNFLTTCICVFLKYYILIVLEYSWPLNNAGFKGADPPCSQKICVALTSVAELVGRCPTKRKVAGLIPGQAHAWVVCSVPGRGACGRELIDVSLLH